MTMPQDSDYVCTLDKEALKKSKEELNEIPEDRVAAVKAFRDWIIKQPHINCPKTDIHWLLRFLRGAKFSQIRAREKLENYLSLRTTYPRWFDNIDSTDPNILKFYRCGFCMILPKPSRQGYCVILIRFAELATIDYHIDERLRSFLVMVDYASSFEANQVNGILLVMDCSGSTHQILTSMMSRESKKFQKIWLDRLPGRFKGAYFYQAGVFFEAALTYMRPFIRDKYVKRLKCFETAESLYSEIPMESLPVEYLPDDYTGPSAGSLLEITEKMICSLTKKSYRDDLLYRTSPVFGVEESEKPETVTEHFRKLNVD